MRPTQGAAVLLNQVPEELFQLRESHGVVCSRMNPYLRLFRFHDFADDGGADCLFTRENFLHLRHISRSDTQQQTTTSLRVAKKNFLRRRNVVPTCVMV